MHGDNSIAIALRVSHNYLSLLGLSKLKLINLQLEVFVNNKWISTTI